ncbi:hypothetical protein [Floridanema evergladense]|uniref:Uncharacterized protein n=1 Tax=Floridaenema evergladense BLCC-F167 TaxID=3153639 RepID=A0ABV4WKI4_9CYAN
MKFPPQFQQNIEKWARIQGVSTEQFIWQAIAEKIDSLNQKVVENSSEEQSELTNKSQSNQAKIYRKEGILVIDAELPESFDLNSFINELREERIQDHKAL